MMIAIITQLEQQIAQDKCVAISDYQHYPIRDLIELWQLTNKHIIIVWKNMPAAVTQRTCETGEVHTLEWLATDYNKHLAHHMHALLEKEDFPYVNSY